MKRNNLMKYGLTVVSASAVLGLTSCATAQPAAGGGGGDKKPNILFIMSDDVGWFNLGVYNQGMMRGKTPNLD